ncbi:MAG: DUF4296 domain-containing protein [Balneolales bacterium]
MVRIIKNFLIPALLVTFIACSTNDKPDDIVQEDIYINLLAELHILRAIEQSYPDSTLRDDGMDNILKEYNIGIETFEESHAYYLQDVDAQRERLNEANRRMKEELDRIEEVSLEKQKLKREAQREATEKNSR